MPSGFSDGGYGNYAPDTQALVGHYFALVSGTATENQGLGCPEPDVSEFCTGPYALFGTGASQGALPTFPTAGFTVTSDLYLDPGSFGAAGTTVNVDVELNAAGGGYGTDNTTWTCETNDATPTIEISSNGDCSGGASNIADITTAGWYRFVFDFSDTAGHVLLTQSVWAENPSSPASPTAVWSTEPTPVTAGGMSDDVSNWGGPGYFWLFQDDVNGLPLANFALQSGIHTEGHTP